MVLHLTARQTVYCITKWCFLDLFPSSTIHPPIEELLAQVRHEFNIQRNHTDPYAIKYALSDGRTRLKQLHDMLNLSE